MTKEQISALRYLLITWNSSQPITALSARRMYNSEHDTNIDWHEFSGALDRLATRGVLRVTGHKSDGMTIYKVEESES